jgi:hypothetical protein
MNITSPAARAAAARAIVAEALDRWSIAWHNLSFEREKIVRVRKPVRRQRR